MGYMDSREAYALPFSIELTSKSIDALLKLAEAFNATLELAIYPRLVNLETKEVIVEIIDWLGLHFLLVSSSYESKTVLFQSIFEALVYGVINTRQEI